MDIATNIKGINVDVDVIKGINIDDGIYHLDADLWDGYSTSKIKNINGVPVIGDGNKDIFIIEPIISITYEDLVYTRDAGGLIPGQQYRIIDYVTTTSQGNTISSEYKFDIIVTANSKNVLSEEARAIESEHDEYFKGDNINLSAWKIWYCLDNDTNRFEWAQQDGSGRGVIYRMIDEHGNDCPYDFKNIMFEQECDGEILFVYTFSCNTYGDPHDASIFTTHDGNTQICNNVIKPYCNIDGIQLLNNIKFIIYDYEYICNNNIFGNNCCDNTLGNNCCNNIFGNDCFNNIFGNKCSNNTFANSCSFNEFGDECQKNTFGFNCIYNKFYTRCILNIFGNDCCYNVFQDECMSNKFGNLCCENKFGIECSYNTFYNYCTYNEFIKCENVGVVKTQCKFNTLYERCNLNIFQNDCSYNILGRKCEYNQLKFSDMEGGCNNNVFGKSCNENYLYGSNSNVFENNCCNNFLDESCKNIFGNGCSDNEFDRCCIGNKFGNGCCNNFFSLYCENNSYGNGCVDNKYLTTYDYGPLANVKNVRYGDGVKNIILRTQSNYLKNIKIAQGLENLVETLYSEESNFHNIETTIAKNTNGTIKQFFLGDIFLHN